MVTEGAVRVAVKENCTDYITDGASNLMCILRTGTQPDDDKARATRLLAKQCHRVGYVQTDLLIAALRLTACSAVANSRHVETQRWVTAGVEAPGHVHVQPKWTDTVHQAGVENDDADVLRRGVFDKWQASDADQMAGTPKAKRILTHGPGGRRHRHKVGRVHYRARTSDAPARSR